MVPKNVLLINDDVDDAIGMRERLPEELNVQILSQGQVQWDTSTVQGFEVIVIDNDRNDLKEAKGPKTLECILKKNNDAEIFFTSFQPGWVDATVYQTKGVRVVKTDEILATLAKEYGFKLRPEPEKPENEPQVTLMITYNGVSGYKEGAHCQGKLIILAFDKHAGERAKEVLREKLLKIYKTFEWRADRDLIKNIFVYDGINGGKWPARVAAILGHDIRMKVQLMACHCDWQRKVDAAGTYYVDLYKVECGGDKTLGAIADVILGITRPGIDYKDKEIVPVPLDVIQNGAKKFKI